MICHKSDSQSISLCVQALKSQKVVIIPTDTVYGFSAMVCENPEIDLAKEKIIKIKGRQEGKSFIQLIAKPQDIKKYSDTVISKDLLNLWPGPLTIICNDKRYSTKDNIVTTAFRCPDDIWLRNIIELLGSPIYSTSVNRSGYPLLEKENEIINEFDKEVDLIILNGDTENALPSTIVKINEKGGYQVIRQGQLIIN